MSDVLDTPPSPREGSSAVAPEKPLAPLRFRSVRPSVVDPRFTGDAWVVKGSKRHAYVCLGDYRLTRLEILSFDLPALNRVFQQLRLARAR